MSGISNSGMKPMEPKKLLVGVILTTLIICTITFIFVEGVEYKVGVVITATIVIAFTIKSIIHEKKDNKKAKFLAEDIESGAYFLTQEWQAKYIDYKMKHPFSKVNAKSMKADLYKRYRTKTDLFFLLLFLLFIVVGVINLVEKHELKYILAIFVFTIMFVYILNGYTGKVVRKFLARDIDYDALENSYLNGIMLRYEHNGIVLGTTHLHIYTDDNIYAIDYRIIEDLTRTVVRQKNYEDSLYVGSDYKHFLTVHMRMPSGDYTTREVELNEFQLQMVIDEYNKSHNTLSYSRKGDTVESYDNMVVS
ncbi:MAG: hypothetical protein K5656_10595 [Lachnospiraceae bacterium]|nr:hypothetical protein [Lachnospiraceae bacterium]